VVRRRTMVCRGLSGKCCWFMLYSWEKQLLTYLCVLFKLWCRQGGGRQGAGVGSRNHWGDRSGVPNTARPRTPSKPAVVFRRLFAPMSLLGRSALDCHGGNVGQKFSWKLFGLKYFVKYFRKNFTTFLVSMCKPVKGECPMLCVNSIVLTSYTLIVFLIVLIHHDEN